MKKIMCAVICLATILAAPIRTTASTSYAVYSEHILYGINWDFYDTDFLLSILEAEDCFKVFRLNYDTDLGMATGCSMNERGFFTAVSEVYSNTPLTAEPGDDSVEDMHDLALWTPFVADSTSFVTDIVNGKHVANKYAVFHGLFADVNGGAFVLEEEEGENKITSAKDGFIVMTNTENTFLRDKPLEEIKDIPEDYPFINIGTLRYYNAVTYITQNFNDFDITHAFQVLRQTAQESNTSHSTQFSAVYDPVNTEVYFFVRRDDSRIWKVSINSGTLESYQGFSSPVSVALTDSGIRLTEILALEAQDKAAAGDEEGEETDDGMNALYVFLLSVSVVPVVMIILAKRKKNDDE